VSWAARAVLAAALSSAGAAGAASPPTLQPAATATAQPSVETLGEGNPRGALYRYLMAARAARWSDAAHSLDLSELPESERETQGPLLARELKVVLDRTIWFDLDRISDRPEGTATEGLPDDVERIGTIDTSSGPIDITLRRSRNDDGRLVWKFSPVLVERLPALYDEFRYGWLGEHVPHALQTMGPSDLEKWQVLALAGMILFAWLASWLVTRGLVRLARPLTKRTPTKVDDRILAILPRPVQFTLMLAILWGVIPELDLTRRAAGWIRIGLAAFAFTTVMFYVAAAAEGFAQGAREKFAREGQSSGAGVVTVTMRMVKILLLCVLATGLLQIFGFNVTTIVAGLGIGGIAVALAAQKTIENLFGGLTLMADKPVRIGEYCRFGTQEGWVEDIGLRSTRVRTPARTIVSIPNSVFSNVELENLTVRDRIRFFTTLNLVYETTPDQMRAVLKSIRELLSSHPNVGPDQLRVRFAAFGPSSLDVEINAYILTGDNDRFQEVREALLLRIMELVVDAGSGFAFPSRTLYMARSLGPEIGPAGGAPES
jgi:MscS family membrane protein